MSDAPPLSTHARAAWGLVVLASLAALGGLPWLLWISPQLAIEAAHAAGDPVDPWGREWVEVAISGGAAGAYVSSGPEGHKRPLVSVPIVTLSETHSPGPNGRDELGSGDDLTVKGVKGTLWLASMRHPVQAVLLILGLPWLLHGSLWTAPRRPTASGEARVALLLAIWPVLVGWALGNFLQTNADHLPYSPPVGWRVSAALSAGLLCFLFALSWRLSRPAAAGDDSVAPSS
jgi:hypothetical protein